MFGAFQRAIYRFTARPIPSPGTGNMAFEPTFTLPLQGIQGRGTPYRVSLTPLQPPQVWHGQAQTVDDLSGGGMAVGTVDQQPLIDIDEYLQQFTGGAS